MVDKLNAAFSPRLSNSSRKKPDITTPAWDPKKPPTEQEKIQLFFDVDQNGSTHVYEAIDRLQYFPQDVKGTFDRDEFDIFRTITGYKVSYEEMEKIRVAVQNSSEGGACARQDGEKSYVRTTDIIRVLYHDKLQKTHGSDDIALNQKELLTFFDGRTTPYSWEGVTAMDFSKMDKDGSGALDNISQLSLTAGKSIPMSQEILFAVVVAMGETVGLTRPQYCQLVAKLGITNLVDPDKTDGIRKSPIPGTNKFIRAPDGMFTADEIAADITKNLLAGSNGKIDIFRWNAALLQTPAPSLPVEAEAKLPEPPEVPKTKKPQPKKPSDVAGFLRNFFNK